MHRIVSEAAIMDPPPREWQAASDIITVVVPTWRRPRDLQNCLDGLMRQLRPADEVLVVVRPEDTDGWAVVTANLGRLPLRPVEVIVPGTINALNAGLSSSRGSIICMTDDDAVPHPDWLLKVSAAFASGPAIGAVGGRDIVHANGTIETGERYDVGRLQWFGRTIGNHHIGTGGAREVHFLKGVNMCFRRSAIGDRKFNSQFRGSGSSENHEIDFCLGLRQKGWRVIYDPAIQVDHFPAARPGTARIQENRFDSSTLANATYNHTISVFPRLGPVGRVVMMPWSLAVGTSEFPGFVQAVRFILQGRPHAWRRMAHVWQARLAGFAACLRSGS